VVVGEVVALRDELAWYDRRPLSGRRIVVTRARAQASGFAAELESLGAEVIRFPTIRIEGAPDVDALRRAAAGAGEFDWIVFTSANGVEHFWGALEAEGLDSRALAVVRVCALGPATAAELARHGVRADLVPDEYVAEATVEALAAATELRGTRVLLPRAEVARAVLPDSLRERGAEVVEVAAYRTVQDGAGADGVKRRLAAGEIDLVTFTASSTARNFAELVGTDTGDATIASIGPITSGTLRELGMRVDVEAAEYTVPGLMAAIRGHYGEALG
jgi:uroporphyrinogen III methyltransferase/synthase